MYEIDSYSIDQCISLNLLEKRHPALILNGVQMKSLSLEYLLAKMVLMRLSWEICPIISDTMKPMRKLKLIILSKFVIGSISIFMDTVQVFSKRILDEKGDSMYSSTRSTILKTSSSNSLDNNYAEISQFIHAHLAQHRLCCFDDGKLMRRNMLYISQNCATE